MKVIKYVIVAGVLIPVGVLLLMVLADIVRPYKPIEVVIEPAFIIYPETQDNWAESAHALGLDPDSMTVEQFEAHSKLSSIREVQAHMSE